MGHLKNDNDKTMMSRFWVSVMVLAMGLTIPARGQTPARADTSATTLLEGLPAEDGITQQRRMAALSQAGEPAVTALVRLLGASDAATRARASYALSGLAAYATTQTEAERSRLSSTFVRALSLTDAATAKQFLIQQLQGLAGHEAIEVLATSLDDPLLTAQAAHTLASIGTADAKQRLLAALSTQRDTAIMEQVILALAQAETSDAEEAILGLLGSGPENLRRTALYALGELGTVRSLPALASAAKAAGYKHDRLGTTAAYLNLISRVAASGQMTRAHKEATKLMGLARKRKAHQTRVAALRLVMVTDPSRAAAVAAKAQRDADPRFRSAARRFANLLGHSAELAAQLNETR